MSIVVPDLINQVGQSPGDSDGTPQAYALIMVMYDVRLLDSTFEYNGFRASAIRYLPLPTMSL